MRVLAFISILALFSFIQAAADEVSISAETPAAQAVAVPPPIPSGVAPVQNTEDKTPIYTPYKKRVDKTKDSKITFIEPFLVTPAKSKSRSSSKSIFYKTSPINHYEESPVVDKKKSKKQRSRVRNDHNLILGPDDQHDMTNFKESYLHLEKPASKEEKIIRKYHHSKESVKKSTAATAAANWKKDSGSSNGKVYFPPHSCDPDSNYYKNDKTFNCSCIVNTQVNNYCSYANIVPVDDNLTESCWFPVGFADDHDLCIQMHILRKFKPDHVPFRLIYHKEELFLDLGCTKFKLKKNSYFIEMDGCKADYEPNVVLKPGQEYDPKKIDTERFLPLRLKSSRYD